MQLVGQLLMQFNTEARESVSRYQVDHFRPHGRAKQELKKFAEGYSWLAFDIDNYRLVGMLCNTLNQEYSEVTVGKSDWFPLLNPDKRANLGARDISVESPLLLDPADPDDPAKILFNDAGEIDAAEELDEDVKENVRLAVKYLGLTQSQLNNGRKRTWRSCSRAIIKFNRVAKKPKGTRTQEESLTLNELRDELLGMSKSSSEFSAVARCCLIANALSQLIIRDEMEPLQTVDA